MLDILNINEILLHINNVSSIYKLNSRKDWIQILCPYCDDSTRSNKIDHGHFYISRHFNYCHCFRCDIKVSIKNFLLYTGFQNIQLLKNIFKSNSNYSYISEAKTKSLKNRNYSQDLDKDLLTEFENYLEKRILNVDYDKFKIYPSYESSSDTLLCNFNNYYDEFSTSRIINSKTLKYRYIKKENSNFYFFQNPFEFNSITLCEGPFDILNLYNFTNRFNTTCFFSINGKNYLNSLIKIISDYYLTNMKLQVNIMFDSDISNTEFLKKRIKTNINIINNNIKIKYFKPSISKDISDILFFNEI